MNLILTLIATIIFTAYTSYMWLRFKPLVSLSSTYYILENQRYKKKGWIFQAVMIATVFLLAMPVMDLRDVSFKLFDFLIFTGVAYVAVAPRYKEILEGKVHVVGALISAFCAVLVAVLAGYWFIPLIYLLIASVLIKKNYTTRTFWLEMVCFATIFTILIIRYI